MRKRLFWQLFAGFFLVVVVSTVVIGGVAWLNYNRLETDGQVRPVAQFAVDTFHLGADADPEKRRKGLAQLKELGAAMALYTPDGALISASREGLPTPAEEGFEPGFFHFEGHPGYLIDLPDGRWVSAIRLNQGFRPAKGFFAPLLIFLLIALVGCILLARRITRRLEALESRVTAWGDGDLDARAPALGKDEIGRLALRFNAAADRVAELVSAHKSVVAHASHELRTPLARLRLAMEMMAEAERAEERESMLAGAEKDIEELDSLIEELLLRSKFEAKGYETPSESVDLLQLAREETARLGFSAVTVDGDEATIVGDRRLLARALKNLLDNARKYGGGAVRVFVRADKEGAALAVEDEGPGVPDADRERIFEPFFQREGGSKGVGLGLALVRDIARHHGGDAACEPNAPKGSRFVLRLPLAS